MSDETTITTGASGTSVKTGGTSVTTDVEPEYHTVTEYMLYKLDRTMAIVGIIGIAIVALVIYAETENGAAITIATGAISGLVGYVGGRTGK